MKKICLYLLLVFSAEITAQAQKAHVGVQAGLSVAYMTYKEGPWSDHTKVIGGIYTGVFVDVVLAKHFTLQSGINYVQKGGLDDNDYFIQETELRTRIHYLEFPLNVIYYNRRGQKGFFTGAGFTLGIAVDGKESLKVDDYKTTRTLKFGHSESDDFRTADFGFQMLIGYVFKNNLMLSANSNIGISNLTGIDNVTKHNNYLAFKAGFVIR